MSTNAPHVMIVPRTSHHVMSSLLNVKELLGGKATLPVTGRAKNVAERLNEISKTRYVGKRCLLARLHVVFIERLLNEHEKYPSAIDALLEDLMAHTNEAELTFETARRLMLYLDLKPTTPIDLMFVPMDFAVSHGKSDHIDLEEIANG